MGVCIGSVSPSSVKGTCASRCLCGRGCSGPGLAPLGKVRRGHCERVLVFAMALSAGPSRMREPSGDMSSCDCPRVCSLSPESGRTGLKQLKRLCRAGRLSRLRPGGGVFRRRPCGLERSVILRLHISEKWLPEEIWHLGFAAWGTENDSRSNWKCYYF